MIALMTCAGCAREPDRPRFARPAAESGPAAPARPPGEVLVPHEIKMH